MDIKEIGRMVYTLRTEQRMSQEELVRGLCSIPTLSRLESGERRPDILVFNAILERLGKASNIISVALTLEEFEYFVERRNIEISLTTEEYELAEKELDRLAEKETEMPLRKQDISWLYGVMYLLKNKMKMAEVYIHNAILETLPEFDNEIFHGGKEALLKLWLDERETSLLLVYAYIEEETGNEGEPLLLAIKNYIYSKVTDDEEKNKRLAQVMHLLAWVKRKKGQWKECYDCCEKVIVAEANNGALMLLPQALYMENFCIENGVKAENQELRKKQYEIISKVLEEYGTEIKEESPVVFVKETSQEKHLIDELVHYSRLRKAVSQEELSEGICTPETLSRIETGKRNPTVKNFHMLMEKMDLGIGYYNTVFLADKFETLELGHILQKEIMLRRFAEAEKVLYEIEKQIDGKKIRNQQYLQFNHIVIDFELGRISSDEALKQLEATLTLTIKKENKNFQIPEQMTSIEIFLFNTMAKVWGDMGKQEKSTEILMQIRNYFRNSKLEALEHGKQYLMILSNLASYTEESNDLPKAMEFVEEAIQEGIKNGIGVRIGKNLITKAYIQDRMEKEICLTTYEQGYYVCGLYEDYRNQNIVKNYVEEKFGYKI